jgi:glutamine amidotransferase
MPGMCRFLMYVGPPILVSSLVTEPENSIIHQSFGSREREEPLNGDGFGVAWYAHEIRPEVAVFRSVTPAWSNQNLVHLARSMRSRCVLAHVRAATLGLSVTETNTHPFSYGRYSFMHNGEVGGFHRIRRAMISRMSDASYEIIQGTTDSEHVFALVLEHLSHETEGSSSNRLARAISRTLETIAELRRDAGVTETSYLNLAMSDGEVAVACRYTDGPAEEAESLYYHAGRRYICEEGVCRMIDPSDEGHAVLVASEPLSQDEGWTRITPNHFVIVHRGGILEQTPWEAHATPAATGPIA